MLTPPGNRTTSLFKTLNEPELIPFKYTGRNIKSVGVAF
jgi:hypothetical protein